MVVSSSWLTYTTHSVSSPEPVPTTVFRDILISIMRIVTVLQLDQSELTTSGVSPAMWAFAEPSVAIIVACAPTHRSLIDKISPRKLLSRLYNKSSTHHRSLLHPNRIMRNQAQSPPQLDEIHLTNLMGNSISVGSQDQPQDVEHSAFSDSTLPRVYNNYDRIR